MIPVAIVRCMKEITASWHFFDRVKMHETCQFDSSPFACYVAFNFVDRGVRRASSETERFYLIKSGGGTSPVNPRQPVPKRDTRCQLLRDKPER